MNPILAAAEVGMEADVQRLRTISHNLANVDTVGFKREITVNSGFERQAAPGATNGAADALADGRVATYTDRSPGTLRHTGNPLDLAIEGNAYFVIDTGTQDAYTRQGTFRVNADGELVNAFGQLVETTGGNVRLTSPAPVIDSQGYIHDNGTVVGQLKLVSVANPGSLQDVGNGLYIPTDATGAPDPASPDMARVRQGFTEASNVVSMTEMVHMLETVRHFEATQKILQGYQEMLDRSITDLGSNQ